MTTLWPIAWKLATGRSAANTWRQVALPIAILCSVLITSVTVSILNSYWAEDHRAWMRSISEYLPEPPADLTIPGLYIAANADYWQGQQYIQNWIEPPDRAEAVLPPGVWRLPTPGEAAVSPALADQIERFPELRNRYPSFFVMHGDGVMSPDELVSWVRPTDAQGFFATMPGFAKSFNAGSPHPNEARNSISNPLNKAQAVLFAAICVIIPSIFLLIAGLSASSSVRDERIDLLQQLGAGRSWVARLNLLEAMIFTVPILVISLPLWRVASERLTAIPILDRPVFRGDMTLRWSQAGLICVAVLALIVLASVSQSILRGMHAQGARRRGLVGKGRIVFRALLICIALYVAFIVATNESERGIVIYMANVLVVLAILPSFIGAMARPLGSILGASTVLPVSLAGNRLQYQPARGLRPFVGLATVLVILFLTFGAIAFLTSRVEFVDHTASPSSAEVITQVSPAQTVTTLRERLPDTLLAPIYEESSSQGVHYVVGTSCEAVATFFNEDTAVCVSTETPTLGLFGKTFYYRDAVFDPERNVDAGQFGHVMVVSRESMEQVDASVRGALPLAKFPGLRVRTPESFTIKSPPIVPWIERGAAVFIALTGLMMVGAMIDQSVSGVRRSRNLVALGASRGVIAAIEGSIFAVCCVLAVAIGMFIGFLEAWSFQRLFPFPWSDLPWGSLFGFLAMVLAISAALVVAINTRLAFAEEGTTS